jgi:hypothetical protein
LDGYPFSPDVVVDITDDIEFLGIASLVMAERGGTEIGLLCACDDSRRDDPSCLGIGDLGVDSTERIEPILCRLVSGSKSATSFSRVLLL